ncbi:hypothetical protein GWK53_30740 [Burkholderia cepacia]|uniref:hypothetical protein n=1 Tax=Burkholderia cepacia TaxID=292 RepID=UPI0013F4414A|nr:hypothetical protein [Burkholderia cepacia]NHB10867.1 hypothetical protein [Burkholderia cepacia]
MVMISGSEKMFAKLHLNAEVIDLINKSDTLVRQLLAYEADVISGAVGEMEVSNEGRGIFWRLDGSGIVISKYNGGIYKDLDPAVFVAVLSHEIGHYVNHSRDQAREQEYMTGKKDDYHSAAMVGVTREAEAAYRESRPCAGIFVFCCGD